MRNNIHAHYSPSDAKFTRARATRATAHGLIAAMRGYASAKVKLCQAKSEREPQTAQQLLELRQLPLLNHNIAKTSNNPYYKQSKFMIAIPETQHSSKVDLLNMLYDLIHEFIPFFDSSWWYGRRPKKFFAPFTVCTTGRVIPSFFLFFFYKNVCMNAKEYTIAGC